MRKFLGLFLAFSLFFSANAFANNKAIVGVTSPMLRNLGNGFTYTVEVAIVYAPTQFYLNGIFVEIDPNETISATNNKIQQFCMDTMNAEIPGVIVNKNDCRLFGGLVS